MLNAFLKVIQHIQKEQDLLCGIREKYERNKKVRSRYLPCAKLNQKSSKSSYVTANLTAVLLFMIKVCFPDAQIT